MSKGASNEELEKSRIEVEASQVTMERACETIAMTQFILEASWLKYEETTKW